MYTIGKNEISMRDAFLFTEHVPEYLRDIDQGDHVAIAPATETTQSSLVNRVRPPSTIAKR